MEARVEGNNLILTVPLTGGNASKSGKSVLVASTNGFKPVAGSVLRYSLNVIEPIR
jgi:hypothetical protein